jgi:hypothetical protein
MSRTMKSNDGFMQFSGTKRLIEGTMERHKRHKSERLQKTKVTFDNYRVTFSIREIVSSMGIARRVSMARKGREEEGGKLK